MIKEATNLDNLAQLYEGWTAWVWIRRRQTSLVQHSRQSTRISQVSGIHSRAKAGGDVYWGLICGNLGNPGAVGTGIPQERCTQSNVKHQWSATPRAQSTMLTVWVKWLSFCCGRSDSTAEKLLQKEIGILQTAWWSRTLPCDPVNNWRYAKPCSSRGEHWGHQGFAVKRMLSVSWVTLVAWQCCWLS